MTTHYILADDYDRWSPGEPVEDVASDVDYLFGLYVIDTGSIYYNFDEWLVAQVKLYKNIIRIETDTEGRILS